MIAALRVGVRGSIPSEPRGKMSLFRSKYNGKSFALHNESKRSRCDQSRN